MASGTGQPELSRLRDLWQGIYSITILDGTWNAHHIRSGEELDATSLAELRTAIRRDYARRVDIRPGAPERMST
jgi:hypothetical protein